jgi:hypothetical protein
MLEIVWRTFDEPGVAAILDVQRKLQLQRIGASCADHDDYEERLYRGGIKEHGTASTQ